MESWVKLSPTRLDLFLPVASWCWRYLGDFPAQVKTIVGSNHYRPWESGAKCCCHLSFLEYMKEASSFVVIYYARTKPHLDNESRHHLIRSQIIPLSYQFFLGPASWSLANISFKHILFLLFNHRHYISTKDKSTVKYLVHRIQNVCW